MILNNRENDKKASNARRFSNDEINELISTDFLKRVEEDLRKAKNDLVVKVRDKITDYIETCEKSMQMKKISHLSNLDISSGDNQHLNILSNNESGQISVNENDSIPMQDDVNENVSESSIQHMNVEIQANKPVELSPHQSHHVSEKESGEMSDLMIPGNISGGMPSSKSNNIPELDDFIDTEDGEIQDDGFYDFSKTDNNNSIQSGIQGDIKNDSTSNFEFESTIKNVKQTGQGVSDDSMTHFSDKVNEDYEISNINSPNQSPRGSSPSSPRESPRESAKESPSGPHKESSQESQKKSDSDDSGSSDGDQYQGDEFGDFMDMDM